MYFCISKEYQTTIESFIYKLKNNNIMKKFILVLVAVVALGFAGNAQNAIGVRGAFGNSTSAELSYLHGLGSANRLELDLGWHNFKDWGSYINLTNIGLGFDAQIGLEYKFNIPLQVSIDFRPQWDILGAGSGFGYGVALGIRYCF